MGGKYGGNNGQSENGRHGNGQQGSRQPEAGEPLYRDLDANVAFIRNDLGHSKDLIVRSFRLLGRFPAVLIYLSSLVDKSKVTKEILQPLMYGPPHLTDRPVRQSDLEDIILSDILYHSEAELEKNKDNLILALLQGNAVVIIEGMDGALTVDARSIPQKRAVDQPDTEQVVRGPREGFVEMLDTNISLLRYRLQTPKFRIKTMTIGSMTRTEVAICYIEGTADQKLVEEVRRRLSQIEKDGIIDTGYLEQYIEDNHFTPFPLVQNTERPDKVVANLLEGRVSILQEGSPFALIVPATFNMFYQTTEDYTERFLLTSFLRLSRLLALVFSLIFPSLYVSVISHNPELIPTEFAVAVAGGRAGVPFPAVVEVLIMETAMEILREATVRLPQQVGGAISIVGVLVVGQAAVAAGFASPITVVVIALTTIASFATPAYNAALALRLLRFPLVIFSGMFGLYGLMVGLILICNHLLSLRSFGVPYFSPVVPGNFQGMKDTFFRFPLWSMSKRPSSLHPPNRKRLGNNAMEKVQQPVHNPLEPLKAGQRRWDDPNGLPEKNHYDSSGDDSH